MEIASAATRPGAAMTFAFSVVVPSA